MTALLTDNLPLLAGAPNGIKKLRELILELAVRGKLVPQDPNDEPANELLKRIAEEKARMVAKGKIKKPKQQNEINPEETPFELPAGWVWQRLGSVANIFNGNSINATEKESKFTGVAGRPYIATKDVGYGLSPLNYENGVRIPDDEVAFRIAHAGAVLLCAEGGSAGKKCGITDRDIFFGNKLFAIEVHGSIPSSLVLYYFLSPTFRAAFEAVMTGIIGGVSIAKFVDLLVPLPPLTEQHRIVAKVDELMALCDRLEARQADADSAHTQLVHALLDSLTQARDSKDFAQSWQRLAEHFHTLFSTESSIDALKQTLLQLAVMGKLVPQDPSDEPASELLMRIADEKAKLIAEGKIKKQRAKAEVTEEEKPFEIPSAWEWVRLGEVISLTSGKGFKAEEYSLRGARLFQIANVSLGYTKWEIENFLPESYINEYPELVLNAGDVLIALNRPLLNGRMKVCIISEEDLPAILYQRVGRFSFYDSSVESRYFYYYLQSQLFIGKLNESLQGSDQPFINQSQVVEFLFAWPPLAEQHRIVAKVDQLMALCDQLKARLNQARQVHEQLANALVEQAVA